MSQPEFQFIQPERPKRRRWLRYVLMAIAATVAVAMVTLGGGVVYKPQLLIVSIVSTTVAPTIPGGLLIAK